MLMVVPKPEVQREILGDAPFVFGETVGTAIPGEDFVAPVTGRTNRHIELERVSRRIRGIVRRVSSELECARTERRPRRHLVEADAAANLEICLLYTSPSPRD